MKRILIFAVVMGFLSTQAFNQSLYQKFVPKGYFTEIDNEKVPQTIIADAKKRMSQVRPGFDFSFLSYSDEGKNVRLEYGPFLTVTYNAAGKWMESIVEANDAAYEKLVPMAEEQGYIYEENEGVPTAFEYSNPAGSWYALSVQTEDVDFYLLLTSKAFKFIKAELNE